ncbi:MAG: hypothetical protein LBD65_00590 [Spirochaetaceae bacterium]|jgi:hypothetical protein|nr:hypothetical protein [Spirochaetaceae bacterium]
MFLSHSSVRKRFLVKNVLPFFALCLVMGSALFSSCDWWSGGEDHFSLIGTWRSDYDGYEITGTTMTYIDNSGYGYGFTGTIREFVEFTGASGVILVEYTTPPTAYTPPGNFQGVYYKDLTANSVKLGNAYNVANPTTQVEVASLALAREKFKLANIGLYGGELTQAIPQKRQ